MITLPPQTYFVVSSTLVTSNKQETAPVRYNLRVVETRLASLILAKTLNLPHWDSLMTLKSVECALAEEQKTSDKKPIQRLQALVDLVEAHLQYKDVGYTRKEMAKVLGISVKLISCCSPSTTSGGGIARAIYVEV